MALRLRPLTFPAFLWRSLEKGNELVHLASLAVVAIGILVSEHWKLLAESTAQIIELTLLDIFFLRLLCLIFLKTMRYWVSDAPPNTEISATKIKTEDVSLRRPRGPLFWEMMREITDAVHADLGWATPEMTAEERLSLGLKWYQACSESIYGVYLEGNENARALIGVSVLLPLGKNIGKRIAAGDARELSHDRVGAYVSEAADPDEPIFLYVILMLRKLPKRRPLHLFEDIIAAHFSMFLNTPQLKSMQVYVVPDTVKMQNYMQVKYGFNEVFTELFSPEKLLYLKIGTALAESTERISVLQKKNISGFVARVARFRTRRLRASEN